MGYPFAGASAPPPPDAPQDDATQPGGVATVADEDAQAFAAWKAERDRASAARALDEAEARADMAAEADAARRREAEDAALCPNCKAGRNNPSRVGNAVQEYLPHCWRCGWGAGAGQTYPAVD